MIDPQGLPGQNESGEAPPCYAPRGDFLIGLAQEALSFTRKRKLEKEITVIKSALKAHDDKPTSRRAEQLKTRLEKLRDELNSTHRHVWQNSWDSFRQVAQTLLYPSLVSKILSGSPNDSISCRQSSPTVP